MQHRTFMNLFAAVLQDKSKLKFHRLEIRRKIFFLVQATELNRSNLEINQLVLH